MPSDSVSVPDPLSGRGIFTFVGSAVGLGTNTGIHHEYLFSAGAQEINDQRVIDLKRKRERRLRQREEQRSQLSVTTRSEKESSDTADRHLTLQVNWFALNQSGISPHNFGRLQNAGNQFEEIVDLAASQTMYSAVRLFLTFWAAAKQGNQEPELYVATNGRLQAVWSHKNGWFLVIEFGGDDKVFWAMYQDADIVEGEKPSATIAELAETLKALPSKPLRWRC